MADGHEIGKFLQDEMARRGVGVLTAIDAAQWLDRAGILTDSKDRPGRELRRHLRNGTIAGARQMTNRRWLIERTNAGQSKGRAPRESTQRNSGANEQSAAPPKTIHAFEPIIHDSSRVLVLGTMPGKESLRCGEYYANSRNLFWPLIERLFGIESRLPYTERTKKLLNVKVALWDVLKTCVRPSSLDSDIVASSTEVNDFKTLICSYPSIELVCFNGAKAETLFNTRVIPTLPPSLNLTYRRLPSTSPANASILFEEKLLAWGCLKEATLAEA